MIGPVLIINDSPTPTRKTWLVDIYKNNVYKGVEKYTYKHVEANIPDARVGNSVAADNSEDLDGAVIARNVAFRDAQLRRRIRYAIASETARYADDEIDLEDNKFRYLLNVPESVDDSMRKPLAEYFHRFLVFGALYDWYSQFGMAQAAVYGSQLDEIEAGIDDILRGSSLVKRPLQPFGPAEKIY